MYEYEVKIGQAVGVQTGYCDWCEGVVIELLTDGAVIVKTEFGDIMKGYECDLDLDGSES